MLPIFNRLAFSEVVYSMPIRRWLFELVEVLVFVLFVAADGDAANCKITQPLFQLVLAGLLYRTSFGIG